MLLFHHNDYFQQLERFENDENNLTLQTGQLFFGKFVPDHNPDKSNNFPRHSNVDRMASEEGADRLVRGDDPLAKVVFDVSVVEISKNPMKRTANNCIDLKVICEWAKKKIYYEHYFSTTRNLGVS
jgi:hypothetical protein